MCPILVTPPCPAVAPARCRVLRGRGLRGRGVVKAEGAWPAVVAAHRPSGSGPAERSRTEPSRAGPGREQPNPLGPSPAEPGVAEGAGAGGSAAGHGADRVGHVGERAGARRRAHPADGRDRGRGGAVQGLVLRGLFHRCRRPGLPAGVSQEQTEKGIHHGEVWPEVPDGRGEAVRAPHQELLHPSRPSRRPGCPCRFPPLHHPGHRLPGHRQRHLPAGCSSRGGVETHRAEAPGEAASGGHHQAAPQQPPAPAPARRPQEAAGGGGAGEPHPCGGGITGDPPAPLPCSCFPAAPGSAAGNGNPGDPRNPGGAELLAMLRSLRSSGIPKSPVMLCVGSPALNSQQCSAPCRISRGSPNPLRCSAPKFPAMCCSLWGFWPPGAAQLLEISKSLWGLQLPGTPQLLELPKSPRMFSFLWGLQPPRASQLLRIPQILGDSQLPVGLLFPGAPQLLGNPKSLGLLSSLRVPTLQAPPWFPGGSPNPCGAPALGEPQGDQAALLHLSLVFVISVVAVAIKSGKGTGCCSRGNPPIPAPGAAGTGLGGVLRTNGANVGKSKVLMCRERPRQGPLPKILMEEMELGGSHTAAAQGVPKEPPKTWDNPQQGIWGAFPFPIPLVGAKSLIPLGPAAAPGPPLPPPHRDPRGVQVAPAPQERPRPVGCSARGQSHGKAVGVGVSGLGVWGPPCPAALPVTSRFIPHWVPRCRAQSRGCPTDVDVPLSLFPNPQHPTAPGLGTERGQSRGSLAFICSVK